MSQSNYTSRRGQRDSRHESDDDVGIGNILQRMEPVKVYYVHDVTNSCVLVVCVYRYIRCSCRMVYMYLNLPSSGNSFLSYTVGKGIEGKRGISSCGGRGCTSCSRYRCSDDMSTSKLMQDDITLNT